jgi:GNAT superfamily N-acetyltransferase
MNDSYAFRPATAADVPALLSLIATSIRALGADDYDPEQIEGALQGAFGVDTQIIGDGGYLVAVAPSGELAACGGYSFRRTLFGGDRAVVRDAGMLDPASDAAKIRAFFVHPDHARRGLGSRLLELSEAAGRDRGFVRFELMATLPGVRLYQRHGYVAGTPLDYPLPNGRTIRFVPMQKPDRGAGRPA